MFRCVYFHKLLQCYNISIRKPYNYLYISITSTRSINILFAVNDYLLGPILIQTLPGDRGPARGVTVLRASCSSCASEHRSSTSTTRHVDAVHPVAIKNVGRLWDLTSCDKRSCLYVVDRGSPSSRVDWRDESHPRSLIHEGRAKRTPRHRRWRRQRHRFVQWSAQAVGIQYRRCPA